MSLRCFRKTCCDSMSNRMSTQLDCICGDTRVADASGQGFTVRRRRDIVGLDRSTLGHLPTCQPKFPRNFSAAAFWPFETRYISLEGRRFASSPCSGFVDYGERDSLWEVCLQILVASDAVGMGLNLNIRRIIFHSVTKYDGGIPYRLQERRHGASLGR